MRYSGFQRFGMACLTAAALAGCGSSEARREAPGALPLETPPGLAGARLVYQRPDGLYLRVLGKGRPRRLASEGTWPRWAPDGRSIVFLRGNRIMRLDLESGAEVTVAEMKNPRTLAVHPDGRQVLVADGQTVKAVALADGQTTTVHSGVVFHELDVAAGGGFWVGTVKSLGWRVRRVDWPSGKSTDLARGCSASLSPDGRLATVNLDGHEQLALVDARTGREQKRLSSPEGLKLDNQKWSNHPDWIAGIVEGAAQDIFVQRAGDGRVWRVTDEGDADRPDLRVE